MPSHPHRFVFDLPDVFSAAVAYGHVVSGTVDDAEEELTVRAWLLIALDPRRRPFGTDQQYRLELAHPGTCPRAHTPGHFDEVDPPHSLPAEDARAALKTLAAAAVLLSGDDPSRIRGRELLGSGAWLLWQGVAEADRELVRPRPPEAIRLWRWQLSRSGDPKRHAGPAHTWPGGVGRMDRAGWRLLDDEPLMARLGETVASAEDLFHHGLMTIDAIHVGDDRWLDITGLSCKVIPGSEPTTCPDADPPLPPTALAEVPRAIRRLIPLPDGLTIYWVGRNAGYRGRCRCHPNAPTAAPVDQPRWPVPVESRSGIGRIVDSPAGGRRSVTTPRRARRIRSASWPRSKRPDGQRRCRCR